MNGDDADREVLAFGFWLLAFGFWLLAFGIGSLVVRGEDLEPKSQLPRAKSQNRAITTQADGNESKYIPNNLGLIQAKRGQRCDVYSQLGRSLWCVLRCRASAKHSRYHRDRISRVAKML